MMGQVSAFLRSTQNGYAWWCPACEEMHAVNRGWAFNGDVNCPTFTPSVKVTYNGADAGQVRPGGYRAPPAVCHFFLTGGQLQFCSDSTHALAGKTVPLRPLPKELTDEPED